MTPKLHFGSILESVMAVVVVAVVVSVVSVAISRQRGATRDSIIDRLLVVWLVAALGVVVVLTLQPGPGGFDGALPSQFNPLLRLSVLGARANTLLYVPVGFFAVLVWRSRTRSIAWATGLGFSVSITIELAQWVLPISRAAEIHDVLFNTLGGFIGAASAALLIHGTQKLVRSTNESSPKIRAETA